MSSRAPFLLVLIILVTAGVTTALFTVKRAAAQPSNMTKNIPLVGCTGGIGGAGGAGGVGGVWC